MAIRNLSSTTKNVLIFIGFAILAFLIYYLYSVIAPFLVSLVIAYILNPAVRFLTNKKFSRNWAVSMIFILGISIFILIVVPVLFSMIKQATDMGLKLKNLDTTRINTQYNSLQTVVKDKLKLWFPEYKDNLSDILQNTKFQEYLTEAIVAFKDGLITISGKLFGLLGNTFTGVFNLFFIPILVFYILLDLDNIYDGFKKLIPPNSRERTLEILNKIDNQLSAMLRGQCIENIIFALLITLGFAISGLKASLFLGPLSGIANFIPYLGGVFSAILAFFAAITQAEAGIGLWVGIIVTISVVQFIDCWYLQPYVVGENAGLRPLTIMLALTIAGSLAGIVGMLLAVPVTVILKVLGIELYHALYDQEPSSIITV
ncbi:MAG: AI-2E family transporter [Candidatus Riflebacteria bacterium]|nr:AI-2E family transporter [Candidatus Riflebacteria bacterium]